jgi:radical SAM protein with 4Fe4S-binding SPASM domain
MLRITEFIKGSLENKEIRGSKSTIAIWNLTNLCNLYCKHCYSSANQGIDEELRLEKIKEIIPEMKRAGIGFAILSGGEPLMREDIFEIADAFRVQGVRTYLSSNGVFIDKSRIAEIKNNFDYVGISIDGEPGIHDSFRSRRGAFEKSLNAIRLCMGYDIEVGLRFTLSRDTYRSLPYIFELVEREGIPKLYISHLVYSGRGETLSGIEKETCRGAVRLILNKAFEYVEKGRAIRVVTGNNESEAILLLREFEKRYPDRREDLYERLTVWGGNQAGVRLVNINHRGDVRPDPFSHHTIGNVMDEDFYTIWNSNGVLSRLREKPRKLKGRCGVCDFIRICNGNSRPRAYSVTGDYFEEDPACLI